MEDALRVISQKMISIRLFSVLILVLMEDALRAHKIDYTQPCVISVLILVLMEDALRVDISIGSNLEEL